MKKRLLCPQLPKPGIPVKLSDSEAHHAIRVCRLRDGDLVEALDGKGNRAWATLRTRGGLPRLEYGDPNEEKIPVSSFPTESLPLPITLEMAILKGDAM